MSDVSGDVYDPKARIKELERLCRQWIEKYESANAQVADLREQIEEWSRCHDANMAQLDRYKSAEAVEIAAKAMHEHDPSGDVEHWRPFAAAALLALEEP